MANKPDSNQDSSFNSPDLSALKDLAFGPDWASESGKKRSREAQKKFENDEERRASRKRPERGSGGSRDRRPNFSRNREGGREGGGRRFERGDNRQDRNYTPFEPTVDVIFVSQDKPFEVLLKAMRTTFKTYELFEIAKIVLGKENRFIAIVSPKEGATEQKIYLSAPDQLPFETKEEAINHVMNHHVDKFFDIEEVEIEPPSGNFQMVNRCTLTQELLAPPNFHRYQEILKDHHARNISNLSFDRYLERVESVKDPEVVQQWMDKMKITKRYTLKQKEGEESEKVVLSAMEDVRYYLTTERKNEIFQAKDKVRLPGEKVETLPKGNIRRSIERELQNQRRFPLVTSNHLRGRLRRCNLSFFKKGSKGITFVCAVKRKPRYKDTVFSDSIQKLIDYVEEHPKVLAEDLLNTYKPEGVTEITEDSQKAVSQDLRWLVGSGYVSEFANGSLTAEKKLDINAAEDKNNQPKETPKKEKKAKAEKEEAKPAEEDAPEAEVVAEAPAEPATKVEAPVVEETPAEEPKVEEKSEEPPAEEVAEAPEEATEAEATEEPAPAVEPEAKQELAEEASAPVAAETPEIKEEAVAPETKEDQETEEAEEPKKEA
ncbi:MAG: hypothetical protein MI748_02140 [Opitutales bacterium]|nr:hypothetical protein [Opitutales bacterium]